MKVNLISGDEFEYDIVQSQKIEKHFVKINLPFLGDDFTWIEVKDGETVDQKLSEYLRGRSQHIDAVCKKYEITETEEEKQADKSALEEARDNGYEYFVNITTENDVKVATINDIKVAIATMMEFDTERGDKVFSDKKEAEQYASTFSL